MQHPRRRSATAALRGLVVHLRLPFQLLLAPIWVLGAVTARTGFSTGWILPFLLVHVGLYGGATAYNDHYDRDEGPIGFLKRPRPVPGTVRDLALGLQTLTVAVLALLQPVTGAIAAAMALMGIAYSHPRWRWKASTFGGLASVGIGQGAGAVLLGFYGAGGAGSPVAATWIAAAAAALITVGLYPITQIYQIEEDRGRGDRTLPVRFGWRAALLFSALVTTSGLWLFAFTFGGHLAAGWSWVPRIGPLPLAAVLLLWSRRFERQDAGRRHDWAMAISAAASGVFLVLLAAALASASPSGGGEPRIRVWNDGGLLRIDASIHADASPDSAWAAVLDYDGLPRYMPGVDSSRVVARREDSVVVHQVGHVGFILNKTLRFDLEFRRIDAERVYFRQVRGDFDEFSGFWTVVPEGDGVRIGYRAAIRHSLLLPDAIVRRIVRARSAKMMPALRREAERRGRQESAGESRSGSSHEPPAPGAGGSGLLPAPPEPNAGGSNLPPPSPEPNARGTDPLPGRPAPGDLTASTITGSHWSLPSGVLG